MTDIQKALFELQDEKYKQFSASLMPTVNPDTVIGVRVPILRKLAKELKGNSGDFLLSLPHSYFEENNLHAFIVSEISDFDVCIKDLNCPLYKREPSRLLRVTSPPQG